MAAPTEENLFWSYSIFFLLSTNSMTRFHDMSMSIFIGALRYFTNHILDLATAPRVVKQERAEMVRSGGMAETKGKKNYWPICNWKGRRASNVGKKRGTTGDKGDKHIYLYK